MSLANVNDGDARSPPVISVSRLMVQIHLTLPAAPGMVATIVSDGSASAGSLVVGVEGLLARLELDLGIPPPLPTSERVLALLVCAERADENDPVAHARETLRLADVLRAERVDVAMLPARLRAPLADAMRIEGSLADRIERVIARLDRAPLALSVVSHAASTRWPGVVQRLLAEMERRGAIVSWAPDPTAEASASRVVFVRGASPSIVAARVVDAVVRGGGRAVWVASDALVDRALAARGLPRCGSERGRHPAEGMLGRVNALAFRPQDPRDALDLLNVPCFPLERALARRLCEALLEWPSWQSSAWLDASHAARDESGAAPPSLACLLSCLESLAERGGALDVALLRRRVEALRDVARSSSTPYAGDVATLCDRYSSTLAAWGSSTADRASLDGIAALVEAELPRVTSGPPQVGSLAVPALSALINPVDQLVVWNAASPPRDPFAVLLPNERAALRAAGATVADRSTLIAHWHTDLRRAIAMTRGTTWLCLPDVDARGAPIDPPSWMGALDASRDARGGVSSETFEAATRKTPRREVPRARALWTAPSALLPSRRRESPSSVMTALGCSLRHTLRYHAGIGDTWAPELPEGGLLYGRLAHALFEAVWSNVEGVADPAEIARRLGERFDAELPRYALSLALPEARARCASVKETLVGAGEALARALQLDGSFVRGCEVSLGEHRRLGGTRWSGRADMVLGPSPVVLDLKWSGALHRAALAQGSAVQLALYAWMLRGRDDTAADPPWPAAAYLVATTATLYATPNSPLRGAVSVPGAPLSATVAAVARRLEALAEARARGELLASGVASGEGRNGLRDGELTLEAPCRGCAYSSLCGRGVSP